MSRILTICSGIPGVGKTHLAVNLALELVRRGRRVGIYHRRDGSSPIDRFIDIQPLEERRDERERMPVMSRGYLGIDILSFRLPPGQWRSQDSAELHQDFRQFDVEEGYDDLLVDTSGMSQHEQLACCLASPVVMLVLTPDPRSQVEAFALMRILQLNGFSGQVRVLVNRVMYVVDAAEIYELFAHSLRHHLDMEAGTLEILVHDECIPKSEQYRQAFSAVFPDAEASSGIVVIVDDMDTLRSNTSRDAIAAFWDHVLDHMQLSPMLPGGVRLERRETDETVITAIS